MTHAEVDDLRKNVESNPLWYHTIELAPGIVTPGWFDLRPIVDGLPWPDLRGKRCLDVGTYDGFLAFEMERRGAAEVVATDIPAHSEWDWHVRLRAQGGERLARLAGPEKGLGFEIARDALSSRVERVWCSVYDLDTENLGTFDVVACGSLMLHLRDPVRALEAIRGVCGGAFLSAEGIDLALTLRHPRTPLARLDGVSDLLHWWTVNSAGHRQLLLAAGFRPQRSSGLYALPFGPAHPVRRGGVRNLSAALLRRALTGGTGQPNVARLATPDI